MNPIYLFSILLLTLVSCGPSNQEKHDSLEKILKTNFELRETKVKYSIEHDGVVLTFVNGTDYSKWAVYGELNFLDSSIVFRDTCDVIDHKLSLPVKIKDSLLNEFVTMSFEGRPIRENNEQIIVRPDAYLFYSRGAKDSTLTPIESEKKIMLKINIDQYRELPYDTQEYCTNEILERYSIDLKEYL